MATVLPARVQPVAGALIVNYPWGSAESVAAALDALIAGFTTHADSLPTLVGLLVDWQGSFRDDFDTTLESLTTDAGLLLENCQTDAGNVVTAAEYANDDQRDANTRAEQEPDVAEPAYPTGQHGPY